MVTRSHTAKDLSDLADYFSRDSLFTCSVREKSESDSTELAAR